MATESSAVLVGPRWGEARRARAALWPPVVRGVVPFGDVIALSAAAGLAAHASVVVTVYAVTALFVVAMSGGYHSRISPTLGEGLPALCSQLALAAVPVGLVASSDPGATTQLLRTVPLAIASVVVIRAASYQAIRSARRHGLVVEPTLIVGAGTQGTQVAGTLLDHPEFGLAPVGFLDGFGDELSPPILGDVDVLDETVEEYGIRRVIVAFGSRREAELVRVLRTCDVHHLDVYVIPRFFELGVMAVSGDVEDIWGIPLVRVKRSALRTVAWRTKRVFDIVVASLALVVTSPVFLVAGVAVKLSSRGPVFFHQRRVGQGGRPVEVVKFRTMHVNNDSDTAWSVARDRVTAVGRVLRATCVDELPQLLSVLKGDMSLVGPRPERPFFVAQFDQVIPGYADRHRVPVGLTGWAQVHGLRGDTSVEERARFDNFYIEHWSLWRDIVIVIRTLKTVFTGKGF